VDHGFVVSRSCRGLARVSGGQVPRCSMARRMEPMLGFTGRPLANHAGGCAKKIFRQLSPCDRRSATNRTSTCAATRGRPRCFPSLRACAMPAFTSTLWRCSSAESSYQIPRGCGSLGGAESPGGSSGTGAGVSASNDSAQHASACARSAAARGGASPGVRIRPRQDTTRWPSRRSWTSPRALA